jgi:hypothetical protein
MFTTNLIPVDGRGSSPTQQAAQEAEQHIAEEGRAAAEGEEGREEHCDQDEEQGAVRPKGDRQGQVGDGALAEEELASVDAVTDHGAIVDRDQAIVQKETAR